MEIDLVADSPRVGGALDRACAELGRYFYTRWMRWCLPSIAVRVRRGGLYGTEYLLLGVFLIDEADQWKMESRHRLDVGALARGKAVSLRVPVLYSGGLKPGKYRLSAAMVDDQGWDWRGVKSVPLTVD